MLSSNWTLLKKKELPKISMIIWWLQNSEKVNKNLNFNSFLKLIWLSFQMINNLEIGELWCLKRKLRMDIWKMEHSLDAVNLQHSQIVLKTPSNHHPHNHLQIKCLKHLSVHDLLHQLKKCKLSPNHQLHLEYKLKWGRMAFLCLHQPLLYHLFQTWILWSKCIRKKKKRNKNKWIRSKRKMLMKKMIIKIQGKDKLKNQGLRKLLRISSQTLERH